eukprot:5851842-Pleurochrysis_carterae.AAC.1
MGDAVIGGAGMGDAGMGGAGVGGRDVDGAVDTGDGTSKSSVDARMAFFVEGARFKMSFGGDSAMHLQWYAGIVGPEVEGADGHSCGFDDGEHRLVTFAEVRVGLETGSIAALPLDTGGLCNDIPQATRALSFTLRKEGQQKKAKVIGVLLGDPSQFLLDNVPLYSAHHLGSLAEFGNTSGSGGVASGTRTRRKTRTDASTPSSIDVPDRRGYQTFRRGDVVDILRAGETSDEQAGDYPDSVRAIVYGLVSSKVRTQLRKYTILYCEDGAGADDGKPYFFYSSWTGWQRAQQLSPDVLTA